DAVVGTYAGMPDGSQVNVNGYGFVINYAGGTGGNDVTLTSLGQPYNGNPNPPQPNTVFVDDDWAGTSNGTDIDGPGGGSLGNGSAFGYDEFSDINTAIGAVADNGTVWVYDGSYNYAVNVNHAISLLGNNYNISAATGSRIAEAVIGGSLNIT